MRKLKIRLLLLLLASAVVARASVANLTVANLTVADVPVETTVSKKAKASSPLQKFPTLTTSTSTDTF